MTKYRITYTMVYNGYAEIEAADRKEAEIRAREILDISDLSAFPSYAELTDNDGGHVGCFDYGETTTDYIESV
jgi:hypothetical protein